MTALRAWLVATGTLFAIACAADPGDAPKTDTDSLDADAGGTGGESEFDASSNDIPTPASDDASDASATAPVGEAAAPIEDAGVIPSCTSCPLTVEYYTRDSTMTAPSAGTITFDVAIANNGSMPQALDALTLRYWFLAQGVTNFTPHEYYAMPPIGQNVEMTFTSLTASTTPPATSTADTYFELSFTSAAGSIAAMGSTNDIQLAFNDTTYQKKLDELDDYSFTASDTASNCSGPDNALTCQSTTLTLYRNGVLVWGTEPGGARAPTGDP